MALQFQNVPIQFTGGLDRTDLYLVSPKKTTVLDNCIFDDAQSVIQRAGLYLLSLAPKIASIPAPYTRTNPSFTGTPRRMAQNQGALLLESTNGLYSRAAYNGGATGVDAPSMLRALTDSGTSTPGRPDFARCNVETDFVNTVAGDVSSSSPRNQSHDMGRIENYDGTGRVMTLFASIGFSAALAALTVHVRVFDEGVTTAAPNSTGRTQLMDLDIPFALANIIDIRVLASSTDFYVLVMNDTTDTISIPFRLTAASATVAYPTYTVAATGGRSTFDAIIDPTDGQIVLCYENAVTPTIRIAKLNAGVTAESFGSSFAVTAEPIQLSLVLTRISSLYRYTALYTCQGTGGTLRACWLGSGGTTQAQVNIGAALGTIGRITGVDYNDNVSTTFACWYDISTTATPTNVSGVYQSQIDKVSLASSAGGTIASNANIYGRPIVTDVTSGAVQVPCCYILDSIYPSIFLVQADGDTGSYPSTAQVAGVNQSVITARIHWGAAGPINYTWAAQARLPSTFLSTAGVVVFPVTRWGAQVVSTAGAISAPTQVWQARCDLKTQNLGYVESGGVTLLAGSCPQKYDGNFFTEAGFCHRPIITAVAAGVVGGGNLTPSVPYYVYATYTHKDARGNTIESMPSAGFLFVPGAAAGQGYNATVLPCGLTSKQNVGIRLYRSVGNSATGATAYLDTALPNSLSGCTSDANIQANTQIPTAYVGLVLNQPMVACRVVVEHQNRLFAAGSEAGDVIYFSQAVSQDIAPEWNRDLLFRRIPRAAGRVVNMVSLDDKLVIFCEKRIGFIFGDGPGRAGGQDQYSQFIEAVSGYAIPFSEPHSVVRSDDGVWFRSGFGLRLLGRRMAIVQEDGQDLASEIDSVILPLVVTRALVGSVAQQIRFYMTDGSVYCYDSVYRQWSRFTNFSCVDCTSLGQDFYHINSTPQLLVQNQNALSDNGTAITAVLQTGWLAFAGLQGFQRVSRIMLLGQLVGTDPTGIAITVESAYDYIDNAYTTLNSGNFFPRAGTFGSTGRQMEMQPVQQKCEAMLLRITFSTSNAAVATGRLRLSALSLQVGLKKGRFKLPAFNKV